MPFEIRKSNRKNKKLMVVVDGKKIHFGDTRYDHYYDRTGIWSRLDHNDEERRQKYLARALKIKDKKGNYTALDPKSPNFWAIRCLW